MYMYSTNVVRTYLCMSVCLYVCLCGMSNLILLYALGAQGEGHFNW